MALKKHIVCKQQVSKAHPTWGYAIHKDCKEEAKFILLTEDGRDLDPACPEHVPTIGRSREVTPEDIEKYGRW